MSARLDERRLIELPDRAAWRAWLDKNHADSTGVWLAIGKKGNPVSELAYEDAVEEMLCFGWIDGQAKTLDEHRYQLLATPRRPGSAWARSNKERIDRLISQGLMTPAGLAPIEAAKADGSWTLLDDVEALIEPDDLAAALDADPSARSGFDSLTPGTRKLALYWVATAKRPETRARRISETVSAAIEGRGPR